MRDPARIQRIMNKLTTVWSDMPDLRFWQLLHAIRYIKNKDINGVLYVEDIFYYEDNRLEKCLDDYLLTYNTQWQH